MIRTKIKLVLVVILIMALMAGCSICKTDSSSAGGEDSGSQDDTNSVTDIYTEIGTDATGETLAVPEHKHTKTQKPVYDPDASCSIYIYMCGSNLESKNGLAGKDIDELLDADIPEQVNVVIETGGAATWHSHGIANDKLQRYIVKNHSLILVEELDNQSMGELNTFVDFLEWAKTDYPAQREMLVVWDHGGDVTKGVCFDENYNFEGLKQSDFNNVLKDENTDDMFENQKFDIVIFDTCFMGNIEIASWIQNYSHYMIASEIIVPGGGLNYKVIAGEFAYNDDEAFGKIVCDAFMEQCKAKNQDNEVELSLYDLSYTDELLNELEVLFANNIDSFSESDADAIVEREINDASMYRYIADFNMPMKNVNSYNAVDLYNFSSWINFGNNDNLEKIRVTHNKLVLYHVGSVTIQPFPEHDYYIDLCNGVSLYFPLDFNKSELEDYISICPIEKYAEFLDTLYMNIPDITLAFENKGSINSDGFFEIRLTEDSRPYLKEIGIKVWKKRKRDNAYIKIGTQAIDTSNSDDLSFVAPFKGEWLYFGSQRLYVEGYMRQNINYLTASIWLNDEITGYNFSGYYGSDKKPVFTEGTVGMLYDENGLIQRESGFQKLKEGDIVEVYTGDVYEQTETFTINSENMTPEIKMLEPGTYRLQFIAADINNNFISSDYALYSVTETEVKALGVTRED